MSVALSRRGLLGSGVAASLVGACQSAALPARASIRVASNQGAENATLQQLMVDRGFFDTLRLDADILPSRSIEAPLDMMLRDEADICMISAFAGVLPRIAQGAGIRVVSTAMLLPATAVYSADPSIRRLEDLRGRSFGVGPTNGLLHMLMLGLLRKKGIDPAQITFVNSGTNAQVFDAVTSRLVDAGLSGPAGLSNPDRAHPLEDGLLWRELPEYTYQLAYASSRALRDNPTGVGRCLAAYALLFRYVSAPNSRDAYLRARQTAAPEQDLAEGEAVWRFIRQVQPYARSPGVTPEQLDYLQQLNVAVGLQAEVLPFHRVADLAPARAAATLLR